MSPTYEGFYSDLRFTNTIANESELVFADGRYHIESSTQVPWTVRAMTARLLKIPASQVRVTVPPVGGGFG